MWATNIRITLTDSSAISISSFVLLRVSQLLYTAVLFITFNTCF